PEQKVPIEMYKDLLELLQSHYGEPTLCDGSRLLYQIVIGKRKNIYEDTVDEETEDITRTLILEINPSSFLPEQEEKKRSLLGMLWKK
ncbi:hypothetical protein DRN75_04150, partial [Nanoarchaeota archaeon]